MKAAFHIENGGDAFIAVRLDTLKGLSIKAKEEVLKELKSISSNVYNFESVKKDKAKFKFDEKGKLSWLDGRVLGTIDGTVLSVDIKKYNNNNAKIVGESWFGIKGAVFPEYRASYENGMWKLKLISTGIS